MNEGLARLEPYPFEKLSAIRAVRASDRPPIDLSIGEPKHPTPRLVLDALGANLHETARYPATRGGADLREAIADWLRARYRLPGGFLDPDRHVLPVNGTREALFAIAQCVIDRRRTGARVVMPNPCYQIYEGAALLAGAEPFYVACGADTGYAPDFSSVPAATWRACQLLYVCSPGNPTGAVLPPSTFETLLDLAAEHDFVIASDECYAEIYPDENAPPCGLLEVAGRRGAEGLAHCLAFHSLSKRSSAPGLRSGFVAGDDDLIGQFLRYRTYHGSAMPLHVQAASRAAWRDEAHVRENRRQYRQKFEAVLTALSPVLDVGAPAGGFYLWPRVPIDDVAFVRGLLEQQNVCVLPGSFLGRSTGGVNPGAGHVRIALVPPLDTCVEAAHRIRDYVQSLAGASRRQAGGQ
jgi:N-succinyldiaminopimelate aminotransferase